MKDEIRKQMKAMRRALSQEEMARSAMLVTEEIIKTDAYACAKTVCLYLSAYKEVDTSALLARCKQDKKTVLLPGTAKNGAITLYKDNGKYIKGNFNITEPDSAETADAKTVDLFIIPALAFDKSGNRLGFGMGCYDRLLKNANGYKIGIGYAFQLVESLPSDVHDIKMDMVICK